VRNVGLESDPALDTYEPHAQRPWSTMYMLVRTRATAAPAVTDLKAALRAAEPDLLIDRVQTMDDRLRESLAPRRLNVVLLGAFAAFAVVLAGLGIYGLMAYSVTVRTREFGIRLALGARRADLIARVMSASMRLGAAGVAIGLAGAAL